MPAKVKASVEANAAWLLWDTESTETITEMERNRKPKAMDPATIAGQNFEAMVRNWVKGGLNRSIESLAKIAKVHATGISRNFTKFTAGKVTNNVCLILRVNPDSLSDPNFLHESLPQIKAEVDPDDELNSLVQQIAGTDKAEEAKRFLRYLISTPS